MSLKFITAVQPKYWFVGLLASTYIALFFATHQLQGSPWGDEQAFYETSQQFSQQLIPSLDQLKNYGELNTPLPFIIYGQIQHLFQGGLFAGRLLTYVLSISIAVLIGWTGSHKRRFTPVLALIGFFLYPYFLWLSTRYYTDIIAAFFALLGMIGYLRRQYFLSSLAFILAIASRQYMLAFPLAIASQEFTIAISQRKRPSISFFLSISAAVSILGWFLLFGGLSPSSALITRSTPAVQQSLWAITPNSGLYSLANIGFYYVIPEWLLFKRAFQWRAIWNRRNIAIIAVLLALCIAFPPHLVGKGILWEVSNFPLIHQAIPFLFFGLICITCWRFPRPEIGFWLLFWHTLIMMKAYPWDKYTLPILMALWFLKAHGFEQNTSLAKTSKFL
jgi:hypothetical protein